MDTRKQDILETLATLNDNLEDALIQLKRKKQALSDSHQQGQRGDRDLYNHRRLQAEVEIYQIDVEAWRARISAAEYRLELCDE